MSGDVVNLRLARKRRAREISEQTAAERRAQFGRAKSEVLTEEARRERDSRLLDGHRRSRDDDA